MSKSILLERKKEASLIAWTLAPAKIPSRVLIPVPERARLKVKENDMVQTGSVIAEITGSRADEVLPIFSSITGRIGSVSERPHPLLGKSRTVEVMATVKDEPPHSWDREQEGWQDLQREQIMARIRDCGIVSFDESLSPLCRVLESEKAAQKQEIVINGSEIEPYLCSQYCLSMTHPLEILKAAEIVRRIIEAKKIRFVFDQDQIQAAELIKSKIYFLKWEHCSVELIAAVYPSPFLTQSGLRSFQRAMLVNVATLYAVYEAVAKQKPLIERAITVAGECIFEPKNRWVRLGTSFEEAVKFCRGFLREPEKLLMNGPMRGWAQTNLEVPVIAATEGILALPPELVQEHEATCCLRCGKCIEVCPENLSPAMLTLAAENQDWREAQNWFPEKCSECGNCSYVCPAHRPMLSLIRSAKNNSPAQLSKDYPEKDESIWNSFLT